ncbi:MAG: CcmD family protein [Terriglobia bacterium]
MAGLSELAGLQVVGQTIFGPGASDSNFPFLFAVYTIIWIVLFGYIFYLSRKNRELKREVESIKNSLASKKPKKK